eukprot:768708-Hanusia_phi.AAC.2
MSASSAVGAAVKGQESRRRCGRVRVTGEGGLELHTGREMDSRGRRELGGEQHDRSKMSRGRGRGRGRGQGAGGET